MMNPEEDEEGEVLLEDEEGEVLSEASTLPAPATAAAAASPLRRSSIAFTINDIPYQKWPNRLREFLAYLT